MTATEALQYSTNLQSGFCTTSVKHAYCPHDGHRFDQNHAFCPVCGRARGYHSNNTYQFPSQTYNTGVNGLNQQGLNAFSNQTIGGYDKDRDNPFLNKLGSIK